MQADSHHSVDTLHEPAVSVDQAYALWSETYDNGANPVLALEERFLLPMLPELAGKTVLDLGCGTGRLLDRLPSLASGQYLGVDRSGAMLAKAARKLRAPGGLLRSDCLALPLRSRSADVVICSFLLGYLNLTELAAEIERVLKVDGDVYVSEFHPDTHAAGWKRSFRSGNQVIELPTHPCSPEDVERAFLPQGFELAGMVEPGFGEPEREIFQANNKSDIFKANAGVRAIFIGHLRRRSLAA